MGKFQKTYNIIVVVKEEKEKNANLCRKYELQNN